MSQNDNLIPTFIDHVQNKNVIELLKHCQKNKKSLLQIYTNDANVFGKNDWKNYLLGFYISTRSDDDFKNFGTKSFLFSASRVDLFLKNYLHNLKKICDDEFERNLNLCKDITIPCSNITSSSQSIDNIIKNFFFSIYAADQIIQPYKDKKIALPGKDTLFFTMFEQKICVHPQTLKEFFSSDKLDKLFFEESIVDDNKKKITDYTRSILESKNKINEIFEEFIKNCNDIFFALMCRLFDIFLNSYLLFPPGQIVNESIKYIDEEKSEEITSNLGDVIAKNDIFKKFSETSATTLYMMDNIEKCFKNYISILEECGTEVPKNIQNKIETVLSFKYDSKEYFSSKDYQFTDIVQKTLLGDDNSLSKEKVALLIENTMKIINN